MTSALVERLELAKQDKRALNALILEYIPFIKKNVSAVFYDREGRQDAMTDAMLAFVQAVQTYNPGNGSFAAYSSALMRNRVINFAKKEYREKKRFVFFSAGDDESARVLEYGVSQALYDLEEERQKLDHEIDEVDAVFSRWGFDWGSLAKKCPKQDRSRNACFAIAKKITGNSPLLETVMNACQLPVTHLVSKEGLSKKALEKYRQFIAAVVILTTGDYPYIRAFLPQYFDDAPSAGDEGASL
jgi:RNA polymerase sigma factor